MKREPILPFEYLKGSEFTENLKRITKCKTLLEMSELLNVPKQTFSTWNLHDRTSHELMVRLHLATGTPIEELAISDEDRTKLPFNRKSTAIAQPQIQSSNPQHQTVVLKSYCLTNGQLIDTGEIPYATRTFNNWNLDKEAIIEIETNDGRYLVDKYNTNVVSGTYLIDMDGNLSLNRLQRLPGKRIAVVFTDSTVEVAEKDVKVIGRVAVTLTKN